VPLGQQHFEPNQLYSLQHTGWESLHSLLSHGRTLGIEELEMKKLLLALTAAAAFSGSAFAADLASRPYTKAPPPIEPAYSWTGFYIFGGAGGGIWDADSNAVFTVGGVPRTATQRFGGDGWFGTVGAGYDWQFNGGWVAGILADGQFGSLKGTIADPIPGFQGSEKLQTSYAAGVRLGYLVAPNVLSYVNAGYSGSQWAGATYTSTFTSGAALFTTPSFHRNGWFIGGGVENNLNIFGISAPGWFMKTEYRAAYYNSVTLPETFVAGGLTPDSVTFKPWVQTVSTSLVYRFNWTGPVVAKY
jgi:outer membrane immunogenic protein